MLKTETKSTVLLKHHLKAVEDADDADRVREGGARCAAENVDHLGFLLQLCELGTDRSGNGGRRSDG